jgi:hypothetical protein
MYTQDFDENLPCGANWYGSGSGWAQQLYPYLKSTEIFHCPSDSTKGDVSSYGYNSNLVRLTGYIPSAPTGQNEATLHEPAYTVMFFEVANNRNGDTPGYSLTGTPPMDIHKTGKRLAPWDGWSPGGRGLGSYKGELSGMGAYPANGADPLEYATGVMPGSSASGPYFMEPRHDRSSCFAFMDGHVKRLPPSAVSAGHNSLDNTSNNGEDKAVSTSNLDANKLQATFSIF